jgi:hypothetical protein
MRKNVQILGILKAKEGINIQSINITMKMGCCSQTFKNLLKADAIKFLYNPSLKLPPNSGIFFVSASKPKSTLSSFFGMDEYEKFDVAASEGEL